jgi:four helix bundle protein
MERYALKRAIIEKKSFDFAIRIINLYRYLSSQKNEAVISKQLVRCGTSIGANVSEAERGQSKADFYSKMAISLKEANETYYWIRLLHATNYIDDKEFVSLERDIKELIAILTSICKTSEAK